jgi:uncharacterized membrane protein YvlD (DUF360 family)
VPHPVPPERRHGPAYVVGLFVVQVLVGTATLAVTAQVLPGFAVTDLTAALLTATVLALAGSLVWPLIARLVLPLSVLTLGIGSLLVESLLVFLVIDTIPGVAVGGYGTAVAVTLVTAVVSTLLSALFAVDDDLWWDRRQARRIARAARRRGPVETEVPGVVFVQIDGLAHAVARRALRSGDLPTLHRWLEDGSHVLRTWETGWSCQTGVSQVGILHGSATDMPAFRWVEKDTGTTLVSNLPRSAAEIERRHSDGCGLLAVDGSSYNNLFTGDAERAILTMSAAGRRKKGGIGAGYGPYFSRPNNVARTLVEFVAEVVRERRAAADQRRRDVRPRVERNRTYALLRAFTTVITRDVSVDGVIGDMAEGRSVVYVNLIGYDEVAHHSGPERADALAVLRDIDRSIHRLERVASLVARPYHLVVLSDHGQSQGVTFHHAFGEDFSAFVHRLAALLPPPEPPGDDASRTEGWSYLSAAVENASAGSGPAAAAVRAALRRRRARNRGPIGPGEEPDLGPVAADQVAAGIKVLASGNLGLVYLLAEPRRLTLEEIGDRHPELVPSLVDHPGVGFVLVRTEAAGSVVLGRDGARWLDTDRVEGVDPLAAFGPGALRRVRDADAIPHVADLMVNSSVDPATGEIVAFEHQVSVHGGLGGAQTLPFVLHPAGLPWPDTTPYTSAGLHEVLRGWLAHVGQPVPPRPAAAGVGAS